MTVSALDVQPPAERAIKKLIESMKPQSTAYHASRSCRSASGSGRPT
jgi:hypothetical protein